MIAHIFKKDLRLFWPLALAAAILQFAIVAVHLKLGIFEEQPIFSSLLLLLESVMYFGVAALIATLVHQDSLVGARQDWLVRPVRRRDLLAAKLLFLLLSVQLPLLLASILAGLGNGFSPSLSFFAALSQNAYLLIGFTLPVFAFVSLTRSTSEALGVAFVIVVAYVLGTEALILPISGNPLGPTSGTGLAWIPLTWRLSVYVVAALAILLLQYFRRAAQASRRILAVAVAICLLTQLVPWNGAFAWQRLFAPASALAKSITVHFDPGRSQSATAASTAATPARFAAVARRESEEDTVLHLPLQFAGIPAGSIVKIDRAVARLSVPATTQDLIVSTAGDPGGFEVSNETQTPSGPQSVDEILHVRGRSYTQFRDTPVTLHLSYSATLLNLSSQQVIPAVNGSLPIAGLGRCQTRLNDSHTAVELRCLAIGNTSQCTTALLQNQDGSLHNPQLHGCRDDYAPYYGRYKPPDTIMHAGFNLDFRDPSDLIHYPVNASMVNDAKVLVRNYSLAGHFTLRLTIPAIRLADWSAP